MHRMLRFSKFAVTRGRIPLTCLDFRLRPKTRCSTSDRNSIRTFYAAYVRSESSTSRPIVDTSYVEVVDYENPGRSLKTGDTVELKDGDFLRITDITIGSDNLRGWRFCSTTKISGLPGDSPNEVCWIMHTKDGGLQDLNKQCVEEVPRSEFVRRRRLILTNLKDCNQSIRTKSFQLGLKPAQDQSWLICRWKYVCCVNNNRRARPSANVQFYSPDNEWAAITRLKKDECDKEARNQTDDNRLSADWRRQSRKQADVPRSSQEIIDNYNKDLSELRLDKLSLSSNKQRSSLSEDFQAAKQSVSSTYTFGDAFCGAGGASRGAEMAKLVVQWGFDSSLNAYEAYKINFPHAALLLNATDFIKKHNSHFKVDILHLSPPCQAFSQANTTPNPDKDKINIATSMGLDGIILVARPRIVTLEQTPGIISYKKNQEHYNEILRQFTRLGFSIRWKVLKFADYGLPQERTRLIIIASSPGEALPSFPPPTHGIKPGLMPFATVKDTIDNITEGYANHTLFKNPRVTRTREPYSGDKPLPYTIITNTKAWHYSGERAFTHRELACLQGFPLTHVFGKREISRHIGNAVPPLVMKVLLEHIVKELRERDGVSK